MTSLGTPGLAFRNGHLGLKAPGPRSGRQDDGTVNDQMEMCDGFMYFKKALELHLPANAIWLSECPALAIAVALPILKESVL